MYQVSVVDQTMPYYTRRKEETNYTVVNRNRVGLIIREADAYVCCGRV